MSTKVHLSYYPEEKVVANYVAKLSAELHGFDIQPIQFQDGVVTRKEFDQGLIDAEIVICILSNKYFVTDTCMSQWIRIHENPYKTVIYVKYDTEVVKSDEGVVVSMNGYNFNDDKYYQFVETKWQQYKDKVSAEIEKNPKEGGTETERFLAKKINGYDYCLNTIKNIRRLLDMYGRPCTISKGVEPVIQRLMTLINHKKDKKDSDSYDLFVSASSRKDVAETKKIISILEDLGLNYWFWEKKQDSYTNLYFSPELAENLNKSKSVLFLSSKSSNSDGSYCVEEINYTYNALIKKGYKVEIIVIDLDGAEYNSRLKLALNGISYKYHYNEKDWDVKLKKLLKTKFNIKDVSHFDKSSDKNPNEPPTIKPPYTKPLDEPTLNSIVKRVIIGIVSLFVILAVCGIIYKCVWNPYKARYAGDVLVKVSPDEEGEMGVFTVRDGTSAIGVAAFDCCVKLKEVRLPSSLQKISDFAFRNCCNLEAIEIPENVTEIRHYAFDSCVSLKYIYLNRNIKRLGDNPFINISGMRIKVDKDNRYYSDYEGKYLVENKTQKIVSYVGSEYEVHVPRNLYVIGNRAFYQNFNIRKIFMNNSEIRDIDNYAFQNCINVEYLKFPDSLVHIGANPFVGIHIPIKREDDSEFWRSKDKDNSFLCDNGYLIDTKRALLICYFGNNKDIDLTQRYLNNYRDRINKIGSFAFYCCNIKSLKRDSTINYTIAQNAFDGCKNKDDLLNLFK